MYSLHQLYEVGIILSPLDRWKNWGTLRLSKLFKVSQLVKTGHKDCFQTWSHLIIGYFKGNVLHVDTYTAKQTNKNENENNLYVGYEDIKGR